MPPLLASLATRLTLVDTLSQHRVARLAPVAAFHLAAFAVMLWSEIGPARMAVFVATWGLLNFFWLLLLRRPGLSAALSFAMLAALIVISRFKFQVLWMTASFIDVMIIDSDTFAFLWTVFPSVRTMAIIAPLVAVPVVVLLWRLDPYRVRRRTALIGACACLAALTGLSLTNPLAPGAAFGDDNYVSSFARSGIDAVKAIKAEDAGARVVMCSALGQEALVTEAMQAGARDFIVKPFKPDAVLATLAKVAEKAS
jgi:DNA-binding NarL/FixJ family response regulator